MPFLLLRAVRFRSIRPCTRNTARSQEACSRPQARQGAEAAGLNSKPPLPHRRWPSLESLCLLDIATFHPRDGITHHHRGAISISRDPYWQEADNAAGSFSVARSRELSHQHSCLFRVPDRLIATSEWERRDGSVNRGEDSGARCKVVILFLYVSNWGSGLREQEPDFSTSKRARVGLPMFVSD